MSNDELTGRHLDSAPHQMPSPAFSANGAAHASPGQRPGIASLIHQALKGRHNRCLAPSGLGMLLAVVPKALPWAGISRPGGAEPVPATSSRRRRAAIVRGGTECQPATRRRDACATGNSQRKTVKTRVTESQRDFVTQPKVAERARLPWVAPTAGLSDVAP